MPALSHLVELGDALSSLAADQAEWSQATFGTDAARGPICCLRHLEKEAREAAENPTDPEEYADCFLLILDAARRAGLKPLDLIQAAQQKMAVNRKRSWTVPMDDLPTEHVRDRLPAREVGP